MDFKIDKEFRDLIPPLSEEEFKQLEKSILSDGVRDPLVVWSNNGNKPTLIEGHHRHKIIKKHKIQKFKILKKQFPDRNTVKVYIIEIQCGRRNINRFSRCLLHLQRADILKEKAKKNQRLSNGRGKKVGMKSSQPFHVDDELAKSAGVSRQTIQRVRWLSEHADKELLETLQEGSLSINEAFTDLKKGINRSRRLEAHEKGLRAFKRIKVKGNQNIHHADFRDFSSDIKNNSVELIVTDPPYDSESIPLFGALAEMASKKLKNGGSFVCYCGNRYLPNVLALMTPHLKFYWSMACLHSGGTQHEQHRRNIGVINRWKPILWFVKGKRADRTDFIRDAIEGKMDKRFHKFGQGVGEAKYFIEHLTKPNDLVLDPMVGGGTTCVAAKELMRRWIGCDIDKEAVEISRKRIAEIDL